MVESHLQDASELLIDDQNSNVNLFLLENEAFSHLMIDEFQTNGEKQKGFKIMNLFLNYCYIQLI